MDNGRNNYIYNLKQARESLNVIQKKGNFTTTEILLMLILGIELDKAMYELNKETEKLVKEV